MTLDEDNQHGATPRRRKTYWIAPHQSQLTDERIESWTTQLKLNLLSHQKLLACAYQLRAF